MSAADGRRHPQMADPADLGQKCDLHAEATVEAPEFRGVQPRPSHGPRSHLPAAALHFYRAYRLRHTRSAEPPV
jgi:hypothetical protein